MNKKLNEKNTLNSKLLNPMFPRKIEDAARNEYQRETNQNSNKNPISLSFSFFLFFLSRLKLKMLIFSLDDKVFKASFL